MSEELDLLYRKIQWRSRRGHLELDVFLSSFYRIKILSFTREECDLFLEILDLSDHEIWEIFITRTPSANIREKYSGFLSLL